MKKQLIASLVGGLILFLWQFLSWSLLNVHASEFQYTANQDQIMENLAQHLEEGNYYLPGIPPGTPQEEHQAIMDGNIGKPWATISYHKSMEMNMGMNMLRALVADILAAFFLVWLLMKFAALDLKTAVLAALALGGASYITTSYLSSIWFESSSIGYLIDTVVQWGLVGVWLGWWLPRN
ncbi:MAG: hypothetical protein R3D58_11590 [Saprospiraceae bacterium]|nr:hypothetical protein [Lewinellaceae bacterium]